MATVGELEEVQCGSSTKLERGASRSTSIQGDAALTRNVENEKH